MYLKTVSSKELVRYPKELPKKQKVGTRPIFGLTESNMIEHGEKSYKTVHLAVKKPIPRDKTDLKMK